jgi:hypothetical protein
MAANEIHSLLAQLVRDKKSAEDIRAAIEPLLPPGCQLVQFTESCTWPIGSMRNCHEILYCTDPNNNGGKICGDCYMPP